MSRAPGSYAGLTVRQADLLSFLRYEAAKGASPSFIEMRGALALRSTSGVHRLITALEERGYVEKLPGRARSIRVVDHGAKATMARASIDQLLSELESRGLRVTVG